MQSSTIDRRSTTHFIEMAKGDPVFFLDTERDEALVLPRKLLAAIESDDDLALRRMTDSNPDNFRDAESVVFDYAGRYRRMPDIPEQILESWRAAFLERFSKPSLRFLSIPVPLHAFESMARFERNLSDVPKLLNEWLEFKAEKYTEEFIRWAKELSTVEGLSNSVLQRA
jgi:hypothetical protein